MNSIIYFIVFLIFTLYILLKTIGYAIYEIKEQNNKIGGIVIISFSILVVIFINVVRLFLRYFYAIY